MNIRTTTLFAVLLFCCLSCKQNDEPKDMSEAELLAYAQAIHERVITLDTHNDINVKNFVADKNYSMDLDNQVTLPKMRAGGLDVSWLIVYTGQDELDEKGYSKAYENAMAKFDAIHRLTKEFAPDEIELALNSADVHRIAASGKKVAMIGIENGYPIGMDLSNVEKFYELGARYMSLSHNGHSQLCDSNTGEAEDEWLHNGVSELGKEVIKEMNRLGMMIDVSHPSKKSMQDMIELSKAPLIASHSSARALCDHSRNLDDEQLQLLKENGGVVQTVAFRSYLKKEKSEARADLMKALNESIAAEMGFELLEWAEVRQLDEEAREAYIEKRKLLREKAKDRVVAEIDPVAPDVNVSDFVDHIDYLVEKMGLEHVGISSDFDGGGGVEGWEDASETFHVTLELVKRGYTEEEISMLWSGNLLRVLDEVQAVAKKIQAGEV